MNVSVLMPLGPNVNPLWVQEAINSVKEQTYQVDELLFIDDGAYLNYLELFELDMYAIVHTRQAGYIYKHREDNPVTIHHWTSPCNLGFRAAFNIGMALASNDLVVYLATDDKLMPTAISEAIQAYLDNDKKDAWYAFSYELSNGQTCDIPNNAAMITKGLWHMVGGYPPAGFVGPDALVLSCLIAHAPDKIVKVKEGEPLYWVRQHDYQETKTHTWKFVDEMTSIRNKITKDFVLKEPL